MLNVYNCVKRDILITGDFNIHFDKPGEPQVKMICTTIFEHDMKQMVDHPTQKSGHILDGFIVKENTIFNLEKVEDLAYQTTVHWFVL